jgi:hypothetical protein
LVIDAMGEQRRVTMTALLGPLVASVHQLAKIFCRPIREIDTMPSLPNRHAPMPLLALA